jgi:hypothetical protein
MKFKTILFLSAIFIAQLLHAQTIDTIKINTSKQEILIAKHIVTSATTIEEITKLLGPAERIEKVGGVDRHYIYDKLGLSFDGGKKGKVEAVMINYNHDGDKKAAKEKFTHTLMIDKLTATEKTTAENVKQNTNIKEISCVGAIMCVSDPKKPGIALLMGFNDKALITQMVFGFTNLQ